MHYTASKDDFVISDDKALLDIDTIHHFLSTESYWAKNIPLWLVEKSIANSMCFGLYHEDKQIGFARLITDQSTFAYLADVFIIATCRGQGLSKWLIETIHAHPDVQTLRGWMLATRDAHELYKKLGWHELNDPKRFLQRYKVVDYASM